MDTVWGIAVSKRNPFEQLYACVCRYLSPSAIPLLIAGLAAGLKFQISLPSVSLLSNLGGKLPSTHLKNVQSTKHRMGFQHGSSACLLWAQYSISPWKLPGDECSVSASDSARWIGYEAWNKSLFCVLLLFILLICARSHALYAPGTWCHLHHDARTHGTFTKQQLSEANNSWQPD